MQATFNPFENEKTIKYKGFSIVKGLYSIYKDGIEIQSHKGYSISSDGETIFRFTIKAAKDYINYKLSAA